VVFALCISPCDTALYMGRLFNEAAQTVEFIKGRKGIYGYLQCPTKKVVEYS
jgi:hypothetical protein